MINMNSLSNWIYIKENDNAARYVLGVEGKSPLIFFGVNPSTAAPDKLDNTVKNVVKLAQKQKNDSWIMLNIYPQRDTNPNGMHFNSNDKYYQRNIRNRKHIKNQIQRF